jgi:hypothetical protein
LANQVTPTKNTGSIFVNVLAQIHELIVLEMRIDVSVAGAYLQLALQRGTISSLIIFGVSCVTGNTRVYGKKKQY